MTSALEALGAKRLRDSIARQGERLASQARTGPTPGQIFGLSPHFLATPQPWPGRVRAKWPLWPTGWRTYEWPWSVSDLGHHRPLRRKTRPARLEPVPPQGPPLPPAPNHAKADRGRHKKRQRSLRPLFSTSYSLSYLPNDLTRSWSAMYSLSPAGATTLPNGA